MFPPKWSSLEMIGNHGSFHQKSQNSYDKARLATNTDVAVTWVCGSIAHLWFWCRQLITDGSKQDTVLVIWRIHNLAIHIHKRHTIVIKGCHGFFLHCFIPSCSIVTSAQGFVVQ